MQFVGLDIGTTGCKAVRIDGEGRVVAVAVREYPLSTPHPGWSEQNPDDWVRAAEACLAELGPADAIGMTGQMHGAVFLDGHDEVIRPAMLWNDQRTAEECAWAESVRPDLRAVTANPVLTGFQLPKLLWLRAHEPENHARLRSLLLPKDYVRFRLTGEKATDPTDASGTSLFHVAERRWADELFDELGVDPSILPRVVESWEVSGRTREGVPVVGGAGDCAAGAVATGAVEPGIVSVSLGTSGVVFEASDRCLPDPSGAVHAFCHATGRWHRMGVMLSCGGALRWFRDVFAPDTPYEEIAGWAASAEPEGVVFRPYLAGERCPVSDPHLRGSFEGLSLAHTRAHLARAVFEGVTEGLVGCLRAVVSGSELRVLRVTGGGARSPFWLDLLSERAGVPCVALRSNEGPAYGAALLAGVGTGHWTSVAEAVQRVA